MRLAQLSEFLKGIISNLYLSWVSLKTTPKTFNSFCQFDSSVLIVGRCKIVSDGLRHLVESRDS
jgi:hypothetical protein